MTNELDRRQRFRQCVDDNAESIFRVAFRLTGARDMAQELVQETYLNAWANLESLKDESKMRGWVFAILRNQYTKLKRKLPPLASVDYEVQAKDESFERENREQQQAMVQLAIQQLDDEHKFPLLLVSMEGMTTEAAGEVLGIPKGTILSRLHRARQKLRNILEPQLRAQNS